jgi:DNA-binding protein Fis
LLETSSQIRPSSLPEELKKAAELDCVSYDPAEKKPWQMPNFNFKQYIDSVEKQIVQEVMSEADGKKSKAAKMLGLTRFALRHQLKKHELE